MHIAVMWHAVCVVALPPSPVQGRACQCLLRQSTCAGGPVLVTGGTGALGALTAHWALAQQPTSVVLLGRTGRFASPPGSLQSAGGCTSVQSCDIASRADAAGLQGGQRCSYAAALHAGAGHHSLITQSTWPMGQPELTALLVHPCR